MVFATFQRTRSTVETLPSECLKTSLTRPSPGANHDVRVPLPKRKPLWLSRDCTTIALNVPAGVRTRCTPSTFAEPTTPNTLKSRLRRLDFHESPFFGYAGSTGLNP